MYNFRKHFFRIFFLLITFLFLVVVIPYTYSRYETNTTSNVESEIAYYLLDTNYVSDNINLADVIPSDEPYIYTFTVANYKDTKRLETNLEYDLTITSTTNMPLTYEIYLNEDYSSPGATSDFLTNEVIADEDGTYFRKMTMPKSYFGFTYNEINTYTLLIYFPKQYATYNYQNLIESIDIEINSRQILD